MPKKAIPLDLSQPHKCARCRHVGDIINDFGTRYLSGKVRPQSHCYFCRRSGSVLITENKNQVSALFMRYFPGDKEGNAGRRAYRFMVMRLLKKLPAERVRLTPEALVLYERA